MEPNKIMRILKLGTGDWFNELKLWSISDASEELASIFLTHRLSLFKFRQFNSSLLKLHTHVKSQSALNTACVPTHVRINLLSVQHSLPLIRSFDLCCRLSPVSIRSTSCEMFDWGWERGARETLDSSKRNYSSRTRGVEREILLLHD